MSRAIWIHADVGVDDVLCELSDDELLGELRARKALPDAHDPPKRVPIVDLETIHPWAAQGLADDLRSAFYRRDADRLDLLLRVLERGATGYSYDRPWPGHGPDHPSPAP